MSHLITPAALFEIGKKMSLSFLKISKFVYIMRHKFPSRCFIFVWVLDLTINRGPLFYMPMTSHLVPYSENVVKYLRGLLVSIDHR